MFRKIQDLGQRSLLIFTRRMSYRRAFLDEKGGLRADAKPALADLKRFCCADKTTIRVSPTTGQIDPYAMAVAEGRREVWNRIQQHLQITDDDLFNLKEEQNP